MNKRQIEDRLNGVLRDHNMLNMVVNPVELANAMGANVFRTKFGEENKAGMISVRSGQAVIYLSADDPLPRSRFTLAHEIGHFALHLMGHDGEIIDTKDNFRIAGEPPAIWTEERRREWEANHFASCLLMPEFFVRQVFAECKEVSLLADRFGVSLQAMTYRLKELALAA